ncbi:MAG TPA: helix-turn-helix domain-containing protein [Solirubrobacteraceae bacterium]|nr:helix-turn-helix domain-containing protein [Solirubrobacteraceae bacterium]
MSAADPQDSFLTVAEVAETLKLNQQTVRNWIDQGRLPALRVGRRVRIRRSDFERILERSYTVGVSAALGAGPSAADFWGGEPVGVAEPAPDAAAGGLPEVAEPAAGAPRHGAGAQDAEGADRSPAATAGAGPRPSPAPGAGRSSPLGIGGPRHPGANGADAG